MQLYLVQHGEAKSEEEDPERPLNDNGKKEAEAVAKKVSCLAGAARILHSPKLRAKQTAEIFSSQLNTPVEETDGLKPLDDPNRAKELIEGQDKNLMLVGHLPHMNKLASLLVTGDENSDIMAFRMSAVVCLEKDEKWRVKWILPPELA